MLGPLNQISSHTRLALEKQLLRIAKQKKNDYPTKFGGNVETPHARGESTAEAVRRVNLKSDLP